MVQTFKLDDSEQAKFLIFHSDSHQDEQDYVNQFNLPNDVFALDDISAVAPRFEEIPQQDADNSLIVVLSNVTSRNNDVPVEDRLETLTFILQDNTLLLFLKEGSTFDQNLLHQYKDKFDSIASILVLRGF